MFGFLTYFLPSSQKQLALPPVNSVGCSGECGENGCDGSCEWTIVEEVKVIVPVEETWIDPASKLTMSSTNGVVLSKKQQIQYHTCVSMHWVRQSAKVVTAGVITWKSFLVATGTFVDAPAAAAFMTFITGSASAGAGVVLPLSFVLVIGSAIAKELLSSAINTEYPDFVLIVDDAIRRYNRMKYRSLCWK